MQLARTRSIVDNVMENASGPASVFVAEPRGEADAAATLDGAAPDTRLNAQRKTARNDSASAEALTAGRRRKRHSTASRTALPRLVYGSSEGDARRRYRLAPGAQAVMAEPYRSGARDA